MKQIYLSFFFALFVTGMAAQWSMAATGTNNQVLSMAELNGKIYVGGTFSLPSPYIACYDPSTDSWIPMAAGPDSFVYELVARDGKLYAGGSFTHLFAIYDPDLNTWTDFGTPSMSSISCLDILDNVVYVSGDGQMHQHDLSGGNWSTTGSVEPTAGTYDILSWNGELYVAKDITYYPNTTRFMKLDLTLNDWIPLDAGIDLTQVLNLYALNGKVYLGGSFYVDSDLQRFAVYDPSDGTIVGVNGPENYVKAMTAFGDGIAIAGGFSTPYNYAALYHDTGSPWSELASVNPAGINVLASYNDVLYAGGNLVSEYSNFARIDLPAFLQEQEASTFQMAPNPAAEIIHIHFSSQPSAVHIYGGTGDLVGHWNASGTDLEIDVSSWASGVYLALDSSGNSVRFVVSNE